MASAISTKSKSANIHFRVSPDAKETIDKAIIVSGENLTEFATRSLLSSATEVLEREFITTLSNRDRDTLMQLLAANDEPDEGLREAAEIHKRLIIE